jgi:glycosyltransferase involved in cell wall biosynthesis
VLALRRAVGELAPDVVHAHGSRAAAFARVADALARDRVVYTQHGIHVDKAGSPARRAVFLTLERALGERTAWFVAVCESDVGKGERLRLLDPARTSVVYSGIESPEPPGARGAFRAELGLGPDVPLALSVGRFHEQKDQRTLLSAWPLVRERCPDAVLALVGSGPLEAALRRRCEELAIAGSVRFVAPRPDLGPAYADADVFVLTSLWEGLPYVVLEAQSHGLPVAATAVDGVPEAVVDEASGLLFAPSDPAAAASAVAALLAEPVRAAAMGAIGRARVAALFGVGPMADSLAAIYRRVAGGR